MHNTHNVDFSKPFIKKLDIRIIHDNKQFRISATFIAIFGTEEQKVIYISGPN